jgi:hypothetical protein
MAHHEIRDNVISWVKLLSSEDEQLEFEKEAAGAIAGDELVEVWFSSYFPNDDLNKELYSSTENNALIEFHGMFERFASDLPSTIAELHKTPEWQLVISGAKGVIGKCGW